MTTGLQDLKTLFENEVTVTHRHAVMNRVFLAVRRVANDQVKLRNPGLVPDRGQAVNVAPEVRVLVPVKADIVSRWQATAEEVQNLLLLGEQGHHASQIIAGVGAVQTTALIAVAVAEEPLPV